jgi:NAD(P)-dependent dehydrogenase (short-subunit alcohol dehydrogenase family)
MLLAGKIAIVHGASGPVGSAIARTFASEGAQVFAAGRSEAATRRVADEIVATGGQAVAVTVDSHDAEAIEACVRDVVRRTGRLDISVNATGIDDRQGTPLRDMAWEDFLAPVDTGLKSHFLIGTAAARYMTHQGSGVILTLSTSAAGLSSRDRRYHRTGGFGVACAAIEEFTRSLAAEVGPDGVRVVCLRPDALTETWGLAEDTSSATKDYMTAGTVLDRMPLLREVADAAAFAASDRAGALTGAILNLTCGSIMSSS